MSEETLPKYVLVFALFAVFLLLSNLKSSRTRTTRRLRTFRRRRRPGVTGRGADEPGVGEDAPGDALEPGAFDRRLGSEVAEPPADRRGLWMSLVALAVALGAVVFVWWASRGGG